VSKHTPGPWTTRHWRSTSSFGVVGPSGRILCADMDGKPQPGTGSEGGEADYLQAKANAALIAAAPDLLAALRTCLEIVEFEYANDPCPEDLPSWAKAIAAAKTAITDATTGGDK